VSDAPRETLRLDRWLCYARLYKTRGLAAQMVERGKVRVNGVKVSRPSRGVGYGDVLTVVQGQRVRVLRVLGLPERRGPAAEAQAFYDDLDALPQASGGAPPTSGRV
jgi:ribosome-associated heat shock protein Hsp15